MSLITEAFGEVSLELSKEQIIKLLTATPLLEQDEKEMYLMDWANATGSDLIAADYQRVKGE